MLRARAFNLVERTSRACRVRIRRQTGRWKERNGSLITAIRSLHRRRPGLTRPGTKPPTLRTTEHVGFRINLPLLCWMGQRRGCGCWADKAQLTEIAEKHLICETCEGSSLSICNDLSRSARQAIHHDNVIQIDIPVGTTGATDMCCRSNFDGPVEAAGGDLEQCAIHLDIRER